MRIYARNNNGILMEWNKLADDDTIAKTTDALRSHGFEVFVVKDSTEAKRKVEELIPEGSEVMDASSITLHQTGIKDMLMEGRYKSLRKEILSTGSKDVRDAMRRRASSADWGVGSVQAVTLDGRMVTASASGSQVGLYAYGAAHLIIVVGTNKIVKDLDAAFKRIHEHAIPLEDERAKKAYGMGTSLNKILIIEKERPGRISIVLVKEVLGF